ncbi:MAG: FtsX-like permease family protein [Cyclobacteriaceae bacterium]
MIKKQQIAFMEADLARRGLIYTPLREELLDHICIGVEGRMSKGMTFMDAYLEALQEFDGFAPTQIQSETVHNLKNITMVRNYLLVGLRNLFRQKAFFIINLFGLTLSFVCVFLIYRYVQYEMTYDQHIDKKDRIYRLVTNREVDSGDIRESAFTGAPWGPALMQDYPEVEDIVRFMKYRLSILISYDEADKKFLEDHLVWADASVFKFFDLQLIKGNPQTALSEPSSIVINQSTAIKYFGNTDPIGKTLIYEGEHNLTITGVMADMPQNSHFYADMLGSFNTLGTAFWNIVENWTILYYYTYLLLPEDYNAEKLSAKLPGFFQKYLGERAQLFEGKLQPLPSIYLTSHRVGELKANAKLNQLYLLSLIALFIVLLALANFINLTTARAMQRAKEVGIRKVMGGLKSDLFLQFLLEALFMIVLSALIALAAAYLLLPYYQVFTERPLSFIADTWYFEVVYLMLFIIAAGLASGIYPSLVLSKLNTTAALKGANKSSRSGTILREGLIVFQFSICIALIAATLQVNDQLKFINAKDLGFNKDGVVLLPIYSSGAITYEKTDFLRRQLNQIPGVNHTTVNSHKLVGDQPYGAGYIFKLPQQPADTFPMGRLHIDREFVDTYDIQLLAGRNYDPSFSTDTAAFIINEEAVKTIGLERSVDAIGAEISYYSQNENGNYLRTGKVMGVVKNFNFKSLHFAIEPMVMDIQPDRSHFVACNISSANISQTLKAIEENWSVIWPEAPFTYSFMDSHFDELYEAELNIARLFSVFAGLSIAIACLGLVGLASYITSRRIKEIGIRKVLGASSQHILGLLLKSFVALLILGFTIGSPITYYLLEQWLNDFVYRSELGLMNFLLAATLTLVLTLVSVGFITIKAAMSNPVKSLRFE